MKRILIIIFCFLSISSFAQKKEKVKIGYLRGLQTIENYKELSFDDRKWKFIGFGETSTGEIILCEEKNCYDCFTFLIRDNRLLLTAIKSTVAYNEINIDYNNQKFSFDNPSMTEATDKNCKYCEQYFSEIKECNSYKITPKGLVLFSDKNLNKFLIFKPLLMY